MPSVKEPCQFHMLASQLSRGTGGFVVAWVGARTSKEDGEETGPVGTARRKLKEERELTILFGGVLREVG
jgi:hypothetical protein